MRDHSKALYVPGFTPGQRVLFAAFDAYPGCKGAQAHIRANLAALSCMGADVKLACLGTGDNFTDPDGGAEIVPFATKEKNILRRSELFAAHLWRTANSMLSTPPAIIHFRDIWSGMPLLSHPISRSARTIFEVNGLPSVEMVHHVPGLAGNIELLTRLRRMELACMARANRIITISHRTAAFLQELRVNPAKIRIIRNTARNYSSIPADLPFARLLDSARDQNTKILLYAGTLAPWQGLDTILKALAHLSHRKDFHLVLASSNNKWTGRVRKQLDIMTAAHRVTFLSVIHHDAMPALYAGAYLSLAPLTRCARNEVQGCCPLKIVESMANSTPVIASDLPAIRELISHGQDGWLMPPDSPRALAGALTALLDDQSLRDRLANAALNRAKLHFAPERFTDDLSHVYSELAASKSSSF